MEEKTQDHPTAVKNNRRTETAAAHQADQPVESLIITRDIRMNVRLDLQLCLLLAVCISCVLSCNWTKHGKHGPSKFQHHHGISLDRIRTMGEKIHNDHEDINPIPYELINNHRKAEPEKQMLFVIQALQEITGLFDDAVVPWDAKKFDDFLVIVHSQIDGLCLCVNSTECGDYNKMKRNKKLQKNKKLHLYFGRLRQMTELNKEDGGESWEIVRKRVISLMNQLEHFPFNIQA